MEQPVPSTLRWQRALLTLCALSFALLLFNVYQDNVWMGRFGFARKTLPVAYHDQITSIVPGGPAAQAGLKAGDVVDLRAASPEDRWRWRKHGVAGQRYTYQVASGATERQAAIVVRRYPMNLGSWGNFAGLLGALIFAAIIAWRRPWLVQARVLCLLLIAQIAWTGLSWVVWITPSASLDYAIAQVVNLIGPGAAALIATYTLLFGRPLSALRKAIAAITFLFLIGMMLFGIAYEWGDWSGAVDLDGGPLGTSLLLSFWPEVFYWGLPALNIAVAVAASRGRERSLLIWTTALLFIYYIVGLFEIAFQGNFPVLAGNALLNEILGYVEEAAWFLTPFFFGYAILSRRLLDVGFVLNRAAVFSIVSIITVATFVLVEWALSGWLSTASHSTNLLVAGGLALALGLSMHQVHGRVDNVVDRAFFSNRRRDQDAIVAFSHEAAYISDRDLLLERTEETLLKHAGASSVAILLDDRRGRYGNIGENDPAIVTLRARHDILDLHVVSSEIKGDYAFPMVSRGRVLGALVLGPKRSGESYAPDELEVILRLSHAVAAAIEVLAHEGAPDPVLAKLDEICDGLAIIREILTRQSLTTLPTSSGGELK